jgi:chromosome segregation ATPase
MTSKDKSKATQGLPNGTNPDEHCINEFFQFISQYLSKNGYQNLQQIFVERNKLQGQLEGANRALSEVKERLADCVINLERRESKVKALEKEKGTYIDQKTKLEEELSQIKQESKKNLETIEKRQKEQDETLMKLRQIEKKHREANEALQTSLATNERLVDSLDEKKELVRQLDELKSYSSEMVPCETLNSDK